MLKYDTTRFQHYHMHSVLVETWEAFTLSSGNIIRDIFAKTFLPPLIPTIMITTSQTCEAFVQICSKCINQIVENTLEPIKLNMTKTNDPMVIIRAKGSTRKPPIKILLQAAAYEAMQTQTVPPPQDMKRENMMIEYTSKPRAPKQDFKHLIDRFE